MKETENTQKFHYEEVQKKTADGMFVLIFNTLLILAGTALFTYGIILIVNEANNYFTGIILIIIGSLYTLLIGSVLYIGL